MRARDIYRVPGLTRDLGREAPDHVRGVVTPSEAGVRLLLPNADAVLPALPEVGSC